MIPFDLISESRDWWLANAAGPASVLVREFLAQPRAQMLHITHLPTRTITILLPEGR